MADQGKRVDVRLGAFACTIEGYDDPASQLDEVFGVVKQAIAETPHLLEMAEVDHAALQDAVDAARVRVSAEPSDGIEDAEIVEADSTAATPASSVGPLTESVKDPAADAARRRRSAEPRHPPSSLYGIGRFAAGAAALKRRGSSGDTAGPPLSDDPVGADADTDGPVSEDAPIKFHGDPFREGHGQPNDGDASTAGAVASEGPAGPETRPTAWMDDGDQSDAHDPTTEEAANIFAAPGDDPMTATGEASDFTSAGGMVDQEFGGTVSPAEEGEPSAPIAAGGRDVDSEETAPDETNIFAGQEDKGETDAPADDPRAAVRASLHEAASPAMASAPEVGGEIADSPPNEGRGPLAGESEPEGPSVVDPGDAPDDETLRQETPLHLGEAERADASDGERTPPDSDMDVDAAQEDQRAGTFRRLFAPRKSTPTDAPAADAAEETNIFAAADEEGEAPLRLGPEHRADDGAKSLRSKSDGRTDEPPLRLRTAEPAEDEPLRLGPAERTEEEPLRLGPDQRADDVPPRSDASDSSGEEPLRLRPADRVDEEPLRLGPAERREGAGDEEPLVLSNPQGGDEDSGGFGALLARLQSRTKDAGAGEDDLGGTSDAPAAGRSPEDFVQRSGAASVPERMAAAAAWLSLADGREKFTRRDVIDTYASLPDSEPLTPEGQIKGYGRLVRSGDVEELFDGSFRLSQATRQRFLSYLG